MTSLGTSRRRRLGPTGIAMATLMTFALLWNVMESVNSSASSDCNAELQSTKAISGAISSPNYPNLYPSDANCQFVFVGRSKERVQIKFTAFNLHYVHDDASNPFECNNVDAVVINFLLHAGANSGRYCGNKAPPMIMSSENTASVQFISRSQSPGARGFAAEYRFLNDYGIKVGEREKNKACKFIIRSSKTTSGVFTSPNYPGYYPRNTECHYIFFGTGQERVHLNFTEYEIEGLAPRCLATTQSDFVELSNFNVDLIDRKMERLCGTGSGLSIVSDSTFFRVTFRSNEVFDAKGFSATYHFQPYEDDMRADKRTRETPSACMITYHMTSQLVIIGSLAAVWLTSR